MCKDFTPFTEELFNHSLWIAASNDYRSVLTVILRHSAFQDMPKQELKKGQSRISLRQIAVEAKVPKTTVTHAINHFKGIDGHGKIRRDVASGLPPILADHLAAHLADHEKGVYTISLKRFYENSGPLSGSLGGGTGGPAADHSRTTFPRENAYRTKEAKNSVSNDTSSMAALPPTDLAITKETATAALISKGITIPKDHKQLFKSWGTQKVWLGLQYIFAEGFTIQTTPIQCLNWACGIEAWNKPGLKPKQSIREIIEANFIDGEKYSGYTCILDRKGISFTSGPNHSRGYRYEDNTFSTNFTKMCEDYEINNPLKKTFNIKEA